MSKICKKLNLMKAVIEERKFHESSFSFLYVCACVSVCQCVPSSLDVLCVCVLIPNACSPSWSVSITIEMTAAFVKFVNHARGRETE